MTSVTEEMQTWRVRGRKFPFGFAWHLRVPRSRGNWEWTVELGKWGCGKAIYTEATAGGWGLRGAEG